MILSPAVATLLSLRRVVRFLYPFIKLIPLFFNIGGTESQLNIGVIVSGVIGGLLVVLLLLAGTAVLFWKLS